LGFAACRLNRHLHAQFSENDQIGENKRNCESGPMARPAAVAASLALSAFLPLPGHISHPPHRQNQTRRPTVQPARREPSSYGSYRPGISSPKHKMLSFPTPSVYQSAKCFVTYGTLAHPDPKQPPAKGKPWSTLLSQDFIHKVSYTPNSFFYFIFPKDLEATSNTVAG
jgi:hypothetical protein